MRDVLSKAKRSALMARMRPTNTVAERIAFDLLSAHGLSFAKHDKTLPGRPDIVFHRCRLAVFIDGDFWHGRRFEQWKEKLSPFWLEKISTNMRRDRRVDRRLWTSGWSVLHLWSKDVERDPERAIARVLRVHSKRLAKEGNQ
jgi:DNA mismatch endonuclease (patch repair protein)